MVYEDLILVQPQLLEDGRIEISVPEPLKDVRCPHCYTGRSRVGQRASFAYANHGGLTRHLGEHHKGYVCKYTCVVCGFVPGASYKYPRKKVYEHTTAAHPGLQEELKRRTEALEGRSQTQNGPNEEPQPSQNLTGQSQGGAASATTTGQARTAAIRAAARVAANQSAAAAAIAATAPTPAPPPEIQANDIRPGVQPSVVRTLRYDSASSSDEDELPVSVLSPEPPDRITRVQTRSGSTVSPVAVQLRPPTLVVPTAAVTTPTLSPGVLTGMVSPHVTYAEVTRASPLSQVTSHSRTVEALPTTSTQIPPPASATQQPASGVSFMDISNLSWFCSASATLTTTTTTTTTAVYSVPITSPVIGSATLTGRGPDVSPTVTSDAPTAAPPTIRKSARIAANRKRFLEGSPPPTTPKRARDLEGRKRRSTSLPPSLSPRGYPSTAAQATDHRPPAARPKRKAKRRSRERGVTNNLAPLPETSPRNGASTPPRPVNVEVVVEEHGSLSPPSQGGWTEVSRRHQRSPPAYPVPTPPSPRTPAPDHRALNIRTENRFDVLTTDRGTSPVRFDVVDDGTNFICQCRRNGAEVHNNNERALGVATAEDQQRPNQDGVSPPQRPAPPQIPRNPRGNDNQNNPGRRGNNNRRPQSANGHNGGGRRNPTAGQRARGNQRRSNRGPPQRDQSTLGEPRRTREQTAAAREELMTLALSVETVGQLEELAAKVADFFKANAARPRNDAPQAPRRNPRRDPPESEGATEPEVAGETGPALSHAEQVREATRVQRLYRSNRKRAVREILQGNSTHCQVPLEDIQRHFTNLYAPQARPDDLPTLDFEEPIRETNEALVADFRSVEVNRRLKKMSNSSPGPDGVTYNDLRKDDPGAVLLTAVFNACRKVERIPDVWKSSNTVLMYKKGDQEDLSNWRPLAMGDVVPKLFAAVVADRLTDWAVKNNRLSSTQKGFLPHEGCLEHNFVLQEVLTDARKRRQEVVVAWLDLSNAFGSVPHATILGALRNAGVPELIVNIVESLYQGCHTRVRAAAGFTDEIPMLSGVRQGCPLSPILFNLGLEPVIRRAVEMALGYSLGEHSVAALAYADDIALVTTNADSMGRLLRSAESTAGALGLTFNPRKCATLHIKRGGGVARTEFTLGGVPIPAMAEGDSYEHLGVPTGFQVDQTPYSTIAGMLEDLRKVDESLLAPWQKVETLATFIMPRLDFLLRGARSQKKAFERADQVIKRTVKGWLNLPQRASPEVVFIPPSWGGCGILPLADLYEVMTVAHAFRILTARDTVVTEIARASLESAVRDLIRRPPTNQDIASYLSASREGDFAKRSTGRATFWSQVREAARRVGKRLGFRWRWDDGRQELSLEIKARNGRNVIVPPAARSSIIGRMRSSVSAHYMHHLLEKPDQGKVFEATSRHGMSNHFMRTGSFIRFADWRFIHRARLDVVSLNGTRRWGTGDARCRRCNYQLESLPHVLSHCGHHSAARQLRHHNIVNRLAKAIRLPGEIKVDNRVSGVDGGVEALRPDIVVTHEPSKTIHIVDVAVPFENTSDALVAARMGKINKYQPLADSLRGRGYTVRVDAFIVGSLGAWDPANEPVISELRISQRYAALMRRLMVSETIAWSRDMYVEHVSGVRQYRRPVGAEDAAPEVNANH